MKRRLPPREVVGCCQEAYSCTAAACSESRADVSVERIAADVTAEFRTRS